MTENASTAQYGGTPTPPPLPYTGLDVDVVTGLGFLAIVAALALRGWARRLK